MKTILFACLHNAGRSQMSAAFFNQFAHPTKARAVSAGTRPGERVHPEVVELMKEVGADLSSETPKYLPRNLHRPRASLAAVFGMSTTARETPLTQSTMQIVFLPLPM